MTMPAAIRGLKLRLSGQVLVPGDEAYDAARSVFNTMIDRRPPSSRNAPATTMWWPRWSLRASRISSCRSSARGTTSRALPCVTMAS